MAHSLRAFTSRRTINVGEEREEHTGGRATPSSDVEFAFGPGRRAAADAPISLRAHQPSGRRTRHFAAAYGPAGTFSMGVVGGTGHWCGG